MIVLLAICGFLLAYAFFLYPALLFLLARRQPAPQPGAYEPTVSILVPVYNEEAVVPAKLANCLALDYPPDKLEIVFASDGSTDRSVELLQADRSGRTTVIAYPQNRGKTAVLNAAIPRLRGEVVVLTDASGLLNPEALRRLAAHFADPQIGCVCGIYQIRTEGRSSLDASESSYLGMEMKLRLWEGRIRTSLSGTGSLLSIRKQDFEPLPADLLNEDFVIPARLALAGKRVVYDPGARVFDVIHTGIQQVFRRRVRIAYGNFQQLACLRPLLDPRRGFVSWIFYSHKLLRMAVPFIAIVMLAATFIASVTHGLILLSLLLLFLSAGIASLWMDKRFSRRIPMGSIVIIAINGLAVIVGTAFYLAGRKVRW